MAKKIKKYFEQKSGGEKMGIKKRILLIEDEKEIAALVKLHAEFFNFNLFVEVDGINGFNAILRERPDLVILDIMLPGENGFDICRKVKKSSLVKNIPIIFLTAKDKEIDEILGLELGADDYIKKPFSPKILFSRIKTVLRRKKIVKRTSKILKFGSFILEADKFLLKQGKKKINLTLSEFGILKRLISNKGKILTREQLLNDINNDDSLVINRNIDVHIASIRRKIKDKKPWIETVRGVGYRFLDS